jgi:hypothetical protein
MKDYAKSPIYPLLKNLSLKLKNVKYEQDDHDLEPLYMRVQGPMK